MEAQINIHDTIDQADGALLNAKMSGRDCLPFTINMIQTSETSNISVASDLCVNFLLFLELALGL